MTRAALPVLLLLLAALSLAGCGAYSPRKAMQSVIGSIESATHARPGTSAAGTARGRGKSLGSGSWTYESAAGPLDLPADFKAACLELGSAWRKAADVLPDDVSLSALLRSRVGDRAVDPATLTPTERKQSEALQRIDTAYANVVSHATAHGLSMNAGWRPE